jgi:hypothetical protein
MDLEEVCIKRKAIGKYVNGRYVAGKESAFEIEANVQPLTGNEILQVPEGERQAENLWMYSETHIKADDVVERGGNEYMVKAAQQWIGRYTKSRLVKIDVERH